MDLCFEELGPWDIYYPVNPRYPEVYSFIMPMKARWPGIDLDDDSICQLVEGELMTRGRLRVGHRGRPRAPRLVYLVFFVEMIARAWDLESGRKAYAYILPRLAMHLAGWRREFESWRKRGVTLSTASCPRPPSTASRLPAALPRFGKDCICRPDEVAEAADALTDSYCFVTRLITRLLGVRGQRSSSTAHPTTSSRQQMFEKLSFPSLKRLVDRLVAAGISPCCTWTATGTRTSRPCARFPPGTASCSSTGGPTSSWPSA